MTLATLTIRCGEDWISTMTYEKNGVPTLVIDPHAQIRATYFSDPLINMTDDGLSPIISQADPGVLRFEIDAATTATLPPGYRYLWDLFGTVDGQRIKIVDTGSVDILQAVTHD